MHVTAEGRLGRRVLVVFLALAMVMAGCGVDGASDDTLPTPAEERLTEDIKAELEAQVSAGLESQLPRLMSREQRELVELTHYRQRVADDMRQSVHAAVTPLTIAAAVFAINGPADLLLAVVPVHKLGKAVDIARDGMRIRRGSRRSQRLVKLQGILEEALPQYGKEFLGLAGALKTADRKALKIIHKRTGDDQIIVTLMRRHLDGAADVQWIARKLERGKFERAFVRRYTFDADIVTEITHHDANISWRTLQAVIDGKAVSESARTVLKGKLAGLMGERLAFDRVMSSAYARTVLKLDDGDKLTAARGLRYASGSLDIVAYSQKRRAFFAEVKNWETASWVNASSSVLAQLRKHNRGVEECLAKGDEVRTVAGKMLIVTRQGFYGWEKDARKAFERDVRRLGWQLDFIDGTRIKGFRAIIDDLR